MKTILSLMLATGILVAGCASDAPEQSESNPEVLGSTGAGSGLQRFEVRQRGRLMTVQ